MGYCARVSPCVRLGSCAALVVSCTYPARKLETPKSHRVRPHFPNLSLTVSPSTSASRLRQEWRGSSVAQVRTAQNCSESKSLQRDTAQGTQCGLTRNACSTSSPTRDDGICELRCPVVVCRPGGSSRAVVGSVTPDRAGDRRRRSSQYCSSFIWRAESNLICDAVKQVCKCNGR